LEHLDQGHLMLGKEGLTLVQGDLRVVPSPEEQAPQAQETAHQCLAPLYDSWLFTKTLSLAIRLGAPQSSSSLFSCGTFHAAQSPDLIYFVFLGLPSVPQVTSRIPGIAHAYS
jgi:hypothetical protein